MLIDTDVLIWCLRGNENAVKAVDALPQRTISVVTRMELTQGCRNKAEHRLLRSFLNDQAIKIIALTPEIGFRADTWMEQFHLPHGVGVIDCLIASTASFLGSPLLTALGSPLLTANAKHFRCFPMINIRKFVP